MKYRKLTAQELDDIAWAVRRHEEHMAAEGHKARDQKRHARLLALRGRLVEALLKWEASALEGRRPRDGRDGLPYMPGGPRADD